MKKLKLVLGILIGILIFSCSSDDDNNNENQDASIIGSWNLILVNGSDNNIPCPLTLVITDTQFTENEYFGIDCADLDSITDPYTLNGTTLIVQTDIGGFVFEITSLTETQLILEILDPETNELSVLTYVRIE